MEQALGAQVAACPFHNTPRARPSLLADYACGLEQIPTCTSQVLLDHRDEVWHLQFSHDGTKLASCSKDKTAILWDVVAAASVAAAAQQQQQGGGAAAGGSSAAGGSVVVKRHVLRGHAGPIAFLCWSPDDSRLATCGECRHSLLPCPQSAAFTCSPWGLQIRCPWDPTRCLSTNPPSFPTRPPRSQAPTGCACGTPPAATAWPGCGTTRSR